MDRHLDDIFNPALEIQKNDSLITPPVQPPPGPPVDVAFEVAPVIAGKGPPKIDLPAHAHRILQASVPIFGAESGEIADVQ